MPRTAGLTTFTDRSLGVEINCGRKDRFDELVATGEEVRLGKSPFVVVMVNPVIRLCVVDVGAAGEYFD